MGVRSIGSGAGGGKGKGGGAPKDGYDAKSYYRLAGENRDEGEGSDGEEVGLRFVLLLFELFSVTICTDVAICTAGLMPVVNGGTFCPCLRRQALQTRPCSKQPSTVPLQ